MKRSMFGNATYASTTINFCFSVNWKPYTLYEALGQLARRKYILY